MGLNYFPHSAAASRSPQLIRLRQKFGYEAVGMFWAFLERLAESDNAIAVADLDAIAFDLQCTCNADECTCNADECTCNAHAMHMQCTLHALVFDFNLFRIEAEIISSEILTECFAKRDEIVGKRKEAARKRWQSKSSENAENADNQAVAPPDEADENANAMQVQCKCNANKLNEIKGNEIKGNNNNNIIPPLSPKGGKKRAGKFDFEIEDPPEWIAADMVPAFKSWLEYKGSRGQGYANARTARVCYDNLMKLSGGDSHRAMDIVNFSIGNNYAGLFPPEGKAGNGHSAPNAVLKPLGGGAKW